jgi:hypothetical protein
MSHTPRALPFAFVVVALSFATTSWAGRPLTVDDAGTNNPGEGHIEVWAARADGATTWNLSPAYAIAQGLEISALLSRDTTNKINGSAAQIKWLVTPSRDTGCNFGLAGGGSRASGQGASVDAGFVNGIFSCNGTPLGQLHANVGSVKVSGESAITTWGLALERELGSVTGHVEWFGAEGSKPTFQLGLRGDVARNLQLDGTVGRSDGASLYSLGLKLRF